MAVGDLYRLQIFYNIGSELTENVLHFRETTSNDDPIASSSVIFGFNDVFQPVYNVELFSDESIVTVYHCQRVRPTSGVPSTLVFPSAEATQPKGDDTSEPVPSQAAALISWYTDVPSRRGQGRTYWPGVAVDHQNDGQLTAEGLAQLQALGNAISAEFPAPAPFTGAYQLAVFSRADDLNALVRAAVAHSNMATIRGRRNFPGVGL
jgi:hypothetical protein